MDDAIKDVIYSRFPPECYVVECANAFVVMHKDAVADGCHLAAPIDKDELTGGVKDRDLVDVAFEEFRKSLDNAGIKIEGITMSEVE